MKDLSPDIMRKRLLIEGLYEGEVHEAEIKDYFNGITSELKLRMYGEPIIFSPGGDGKEENQGYDAFVPLIDSGISLYVWSVKKFTSIIIYTCKDFDDVKAIAFTKQFFDIEKTESMCF